MAINSTYSLKEIQNFVEKSLDDFVKAHREELIEALDRDDYDEVPPLPSYWAYYDGELVPRVEDMMSQSGYDNEQIKRIFDWGNGLFWRSILPSVRYNYRERQHVA